MLESVVHIIVSYLDNYSEIIELLNFFPPQYPNLIKIYHKDKKLPFSISNYKIQELNLDDCLPLISAINSHLPNLCIVKINLDFDKFNRTTDIQLFVNQLLKLVKENSQLLIYVILHRYVYDSIITNLHANLILTRGKPSHEELLTVIAVKHNNIIKSSSEYMGGLHDLMLVPNPNINLFKSVYKRHTYFQTESIQ